MFSFALEFKDEAEARSAARKLLLRFKVTGEVTTLPLPGGKWLLSVDSEKKLPESCLRGLKGAAGKAGA